MLWRRKSRMGVCETDMLRKLLSNDPSFLERTTSVDWIRFFKIAGANRVLYLASSKLQQHQPSLALPHKIADLLEAISKKGETLRAKAKKTMRFVDTVFNELGVDYRVIKTDKGFPYIFNDIDILVPNKDFRRSKVALEAKDHRLGTERDGIQSHLNFSSLVPVDLHTSMRIRSPQGTVEDVVLINGTQYVDWAFIWNSPMGSWDSDFPCPKPSPTADACMVMLNTLFGQFYISMLDCFFFQKHADQIDFHAIYGQAKKYRWPAAFELYMSKLAELMESALEDTDLATQIKRYSRFGVSGRRRKPQMPYLFSFPEMIRIFREKYPYTSVDYFNFFYYPFTFIRYLITGGTRTPITGPWFDFSQC